MQDIPYHLGMQMHPFSQNLHKTGSSLVEPVLVLNHLQKKNKIFLSMLEFNLFKIYQVYKRVNG